MPLTGESNQEKWLLLGASRGLGRAFADLAKAKGVSSLQIISRKTAAWPADFTKETEWESLVDKIFSEKPDRLFYFAGGGPHGDYELKAWKDHQWAYRLNFLFPAYLLHRSLQDKNLKQLVFIGSAIAESSPDAQASSYSAAKHALKGLISSVQSEIRNKASALDLRLFSPGYMDTDLLPADAWPRQQAGLVLPVDIVSEQIWQWAHRQNDANTHLVFTEKSLLK